MNLETKTDIFPLLPLRDIVVFPSMVVPLFVGREKSVRALEEVVRREGKILLVTQKSGGVDDPKETDLYHVGTVGNILQLLRLPDGTVKVLVEGIARANIKEFVSGGDYFQVLAEIADEQHGSSEEAEGIFRAVLSQFEQYVKLNKKIQPETLGTVGKITNPALLADTIAAHMSVDIKEKQKILEMFTVTERLEHLFSLMENEISVLNTERRIRSRVKRQMEKTQREYYLNEQMKAIQKELGEGEDGKDEIGQLEETIKKTRLSKEAREKAMGELKKLRTMSSMSAEASVIRNYLDWMTTIPWKKTSRIISDLKFAQKVLDEDHYGLDKVKDRVLEYLAVQQRTKQVRSQILCIVGPPGVGKTSLAKSVARATGRNFVRISLGGVRDEAEIRGHRRTYIGSMPGKIIQSMKKAKTSNPLFLLDEIDKMGSDYRGDPAAALLEVLDPEQNKTFADHYLEVDYDLSDVMFIATANSTNMPRPLLDRMEMIRIPGYTEDEKVHIAKRHLIPKQMKMHGLKKEEWSLSEDALRDTIRYYTREAGVRNLEREIANMARKSVKDILMKGKNAIKVSTNNLAKFAGVRKFTYGEVEKEDLVGMVTGLAWTEVGGDLLVIEAVTMPGKGNTAITGKLGDVMQESVKAAIAYVRSRSLAFGIIPPVFQQKDIHVHVPEGATPKDGPSAGIAMTTAIVSVLTGIPVKKSVAMTGEVTLRGRVLAIGGLKEKLLAALRGGITTVLIPQENVKDLQEIPDNVKRDLTVIPVSTVDEVLKHALTKMPEAVEWSPAKDKDGLPIMPKTDGGDPIVTH
ncbi:MAG: endopeptidase La [Rickettsiales bacterium]|jgi:ATP-dependent Lon protease|nr:endopeptidase La [Rickettsiales bacterium]